MRQAVQEYSFHIILHRSDTWRILQSCLYLPSINSHSQLVTVKLNSLKVINSHSHLLAQGCCYRFPARSQLFQHGRFLQISEMESGQTAHEEKVECNQYTLQWYGQKASSNAEGFTHYHQQNGLNSIPVATFPNSAINSKQSVPV